jgi:hypothetical protein
MQIGWFALADNDTSGSFFGSLQLAKKIIPVKRIRVLNCFINVSVLIIFILSCLIIYTKLYIVLIVKASVYCLVSIIS